MMVTGVIAVHNHRDWVNQAILSLAEQDYRPLRLVVIDDGSSDGSSAQVLSLLEDIRRPPGNPTPQVYLGRLANQVEVMLQRFEVARGPAAARNWGMRVGWEGTDYFALLDSDDLYRPGKITQSVARMQSCAHIGLVYSDYDTLAADGTLQRQYKEPYSRARLFRECIVNCDSVIRKSALAECGVFDESLRVAEDYELWLRISEKYILEHLALPLLTIRVGQHSSSSTVSREVWLDCHRRIREKYARPAL